MSTQGLHELEHAFYLGPCRYAPNEVCLISLAYEYGLFITAACPKFFAMTMYDDLARCLRLGVSVVVDVTNLLGLFLGLLHRLLRDVPILHAPHDVLTSCHKLIFVTYCLIAVRPTLHLRLLICILAIVLGIRHLNRTLHSHTF